MASCRPFILSDAATDGPGARRRSSGHAGLIPKRLLAEDRTKDTKIVQRSNEHKALPEPRELLSHSRGASLSLEIY
jgi:hypothetical protein